MTEPVFVRAGETNVFVRELDRPYPLIAKGEGVWLDFAGLLLDHVLARFTEPESGALYDTAADAEKLIRRPQDPTDNATPSGWTNWTDSRPRQVRDRLPACG